MVQGLGVNSNSSMLNMQVKPENFTPKLSAKLSVSASSSSVTFSTVTGTLSQTFFITNKGSNGAYIAWGVGSATAVTSTSTPTANCHYVAASSILVLDFTSSSGIVNTIAAIQDGGSTTLEISVGYGQ